MDKTAGLLGSDMQLAASFFERIIATTEGSTDQDHIKLNILIDTGLDEKSAEETAALAGQLKESGADFVVYAGSNWLVLRALRESGVLPVVCSRTGALDDALADRVIVMAGGKLKR